MEYQQQIVSKRISPLIGLATFCLLIGGCINLDLSDIIIDMRFLPGVSVHPLYEEKDLIFDEGLLGTWTDKSNTKLTFEKAEDPNTYVLTAVIDPNMREDKLLVYLVKIDDMLFLDISPAKPSIDDIRFQQMLHVPCHIFLRVKQITPCLKIQTVSFADMIENNPDILKHETIKSNILITASTKQLQEFLKQHRNNGSLFETAPELTKIKEQVN